MLSDRLYWGLNIFLPFFATLGVFKYTWCPKTRLFILIPASKLNTKLINFNVACLSIWLTFHVLQLVRFYHAKDYSQFVFLLTTTTCMIVVVEAFLVTNWWGEEFFLTFNSILMFLRYMHGMYLPIINPNRNRHFKLVDTCVASFMALGVFCSILAAIAFTYNPKFPNVFGNVLPTGLWYLFPIIYLFPIYNTFIYYNVIMLVLSSALLYGTIYIPTVLTELQMGKKHYKSFQTLQQPEALIKVYRCVQIIQGLTNDFAGQFLIPSQALGTNLSVFGGYMVIRHYTTMAVAPMILLGIWACLAPLIWGTGLTMGGYVHSQGNRILSSWKYHKWESKAEKRLMVRFRLSCRPIVVAFGSIYIVRRCSLMVFVRGILRGLVRTLLTLEQD